MRRVAVVGASLAGLELAKAARRGGYDGELVVFGAEPDMPYDRPPLSKELLTGAFSPTDAVLDAAEAVDVEWRLGQAVTRLDAGARTLAVGDGPAEAFDAVVIATGVSAIRPRALAADELDGVHVVRTMADSVRLVHDLDDGPQHVVVVGGGFIGSEVASSCRARGVSVTLVEGAELPMALAVGPEVATGMTRIMREHGVDVRTGVQVSGLTGHGRVEAVVLGDGTTIAADVVVLAVGTRPNTSWLEGSGLTLDDGVVCDETGMAAPGVYATGDVARLPNSRYDELRRIEHWDNAIRHAHHVAESLFGTPAAYRPVPWFWSDQFGRKLQVLGSARTYDEFRFVKGTPDDNSFFGLYRRGRRLVAAASLSSSKAMLTVRPLLDRDASWDEALAAFDQPRLDAPLTKKP
jgi:NADPH-dependent 2,4-dienoyl-CoA reductase/sulfur reductase-like enzyme